MKTDDILGYLADLAPQAGTSDTIQVKNRRDLLMIPSLEAKPREARFRAQALTAPVDGTFRRDAEMATTMANAHVVARERMFPLRFFHEEEGVERLARIDALAPTENLLQLGFLWLSGRARVLGEDHPFLIPLVSSSVVARDPSFGRREFQLLSDFEFNASLGTADQFDELESDVKQLMLDLFVDRHHQADRRVRQFSRKLASVLELPDMVVADAAHHPFDSRKKDGLHLFPGVGLYLARDVTSITVAATLRSWMGSMLANTAFDALYRPPRQLPDVPDETVESPVHLNRRQEQAIVAARHRQVSVVSGPPGTGKTHVVAAMALDEVARGRSVLVATQSDHAARVVTEHLARLHAPGYVRFGREDQRTSAADYLSGGISEVTRSELRDRQEAFESARERLDNTLSALHQQLDGEAHIVDSLLDRVRYPTVRAAFPNLQHADVGSIRRAMSRYGRSNGWWSRLRLRRMLSRLGANHSASLDDLATSLDIEEAERAARRVFESRSESRQLWDLAESQAHTVRKLHGDFVEASVGRRAWGNRRSVAALASALRSGRAARRQMLRESDFEEALEALPLWIGTLTEIDDTLPAAPGVFDLVIFDEASQISQIRAATALLRARRTVVVGDPRQLRHVSFTADGTMDQAARAHGLSATDRQVLDVRRNSLYDAAASAAPVIVLEEHFRSAPHIIEFSNRAFYDGDMRLMTQHPSKESEDAIDVVAVGGRRDETGVNAVEVDEALAIARGFAGRSLAIVSPFRAQADALEAAFVDAFSAEAIRSRGVRVGTVHAMQGSERDVVVLSLTIDNDALTSRRFIEDRHLFNTMITRARDRVIVLASFDESALPDGLLADYLRYSHEPPVPSWDMALPAGWIGEIGTRLRGYGLRVVPNYPVAGWSVDLAVGTGPEAIGVMCGVHPAGAEAHISRQSALRRAGWELIDAFESVHLAFPEQAVARVVERVLARMPSGD